MTKRTTPNISGTINNHQDLPNINILITLGIIIIDPITSKIIPAIFFSLAAEIFFREAIIKTNPMTKRNTPIIIWMIYIYLYLILNILNRIMTTLPK